MSIKYGTNGELKERYVYMSKRLPEEYQEVEYIESSGTQYINTGYTPNIDTEIETDISWGNQTVGWAVFFGVTGNDSSVDGVLARIYDNSAGTYNPWFCNATYGEAQITIATDTFNNIILKKNGGSINGTPYTLTTSGTPYQSAMDMFAGNNGGTHGWRASKCKIKTFKISESGILARNFVPCYRKSDNVIGMYDLVNKVFYTNQGTGTFTKGNNKDTPGLRNVTEVYIGNGDSTATKIRPGWTPGADTVLYCPLKDDILDHSGNHTMTLTTSSYGTVAKDSTGFYYFNGGYISSEAYSGPITAGTLSMWVKKSSSKSGGDSRYTWSVSAHYRGSSPFHCGLAFNFGGYGGQSGNFSAGATSGTTNKSISGPTMGSWELWTMTYDNTVGAKFYRNGVYEDSFSNTSNLMNVSLPTFIGATNPYTDQYFDGYLSDVIIESKARTAQEVLNYYNRTKGNYGLYLTNQRWIDRQTNERKEYITFIC